MIKKISGESLDKLQTRFFLRASKDGTYCPCCLRWGKFNPYVVNGPKVAALVWCARSYGLETFWLPDNSLFSSITYFKNWGFLEKSERPDDPESSERNRYWRLTKRGLNFTKGKLRIDKRLIVYNDKVLKVLDDEKLSVREALSEGGFDLDTVMGMTAEMSPSEFEISVKLIFDNHREAERARKKRRRNG